METLPPVCTDSEGILAAVVLAKKALATRDIPVGALLCDPKGYVVGWGVNQREALNDPTAHAELTALKMAALRLGRWRLNDLTCYVTLEPCPMCASALFQARVGAVVFGAYDAVMGAAGSRYNLLAPKPGHGGGSPVPRVTGGVHEAACVALLQDVFTRE